MELRGRARSAAVAVAVAAITTVTTATTASCREAISAIELQTVTSSPISENPRFSSSTATGGDEEGGTERMQWNTMDVEQPIVIEFFKTNPFLQSSDHQCQNDGCAMMAISHAPLWSIRAPLWISILIIQVSQIGMPRDPAALSIFLSKLAG